MKVAVLTGNREVRLDKRPKPIPGEGEAVVKVALSSLCGTDTDFYRAALEGPRPSGHEFTGQVAAIGSGVKRFAVGDRVVACWGVGCGNCPYCAAGKPHLCDNVILFQGTHAEYVAVPHADGTLAKLPDAMSWEAAVVVACSFSTGAYGVKMSSISASDTVVILGLGAVGLSTVLCAAADKAKRIVAADPLTHRRDEALRLGAHEVGDPTDSQWLRSMNATADLVLIATAHPQAVEAAVPMARKEGRITVIGSQAHAQVPFARFTQFGLHMMATYSMIGGDYMRRIIEDVVSGRIEARKLESMVTHTFPLERIKDAYELFSSHSGNCIKVAIDCTGSTSAR